MNPFVILAALFLREQRENEMIAAYISRGMSYAEAQDQVARDTATPVLDFIWGIICAICAVVALVWVGCFFVALFQT